MTNEVIEDAKDAKLIERLEEETLSFLDDITELDSNVVQVDEALNLLLASQNSIPSGKSLFEAKPMPRKGDLYLEHIAVAKFGKDEWKIFKTKLVTWCKKEGYNPNHFMAKFALEASMNPNAVNWGTDKQGRKYMRAVGLNQMTRVAREDGIKRGWLPKAPLRSAAAYLKLRPSEQLDYAFQYFKLLERTYASRSHKSNPDAAYGEYRHLPIESVADMHLLNLYPSTFLKGEWLIADPRKSNWQRNVVKANPGLALPADSKCPRCITRWSHKKWIAKCLSRYPSHPDVTITL